MAVSISEYTVELIPNVFVLFLIASLLAEAAVVSWQFCRECCSVSDIICGWLYIDWQACGGGVLDRYYSDLLCTIMFSDIIQICCVPLCFLIFNFI